LTTKNTKWGISHAFSFWHRYVQLTERFSKMIQDKGRLSIQDMIDAQLDVHDYQAQLSTNVIISNVQKGLESALEVSLKTKAERDTMRNYIKKSFKLLQDWDYGF
jgi:acyl-homoserine lactone acylase PvdQ